MNIIWAIPIASIVFSHGGTQEMSFTGSTPASPIVRTFLGISLADSIDFIRWKIDIQNDKYGLRCNYGIGKPNTNGFIDGGKWVELNGSLNKEENYYHLHNGHKTLELVQLNPDLLYIADAQKHLLAGNGGWSYTLNNVAPSRTNQISITGTEIVFKDSMTFQGRTPCGLAGVQTVDKACYKLKWYLVLYCDGKKNETGRYRVRGTAWGNRINVGIWKMIKATDRTIYQLMDDQGNALISLLSLDENVIAFCDTHGKPLVGDENFSYSLSRKW